MASSPHPRRLGRYPIILLSLLGFFIFGFGTAFVNSFYQYLFFRFFMAQASMGYGICSVSLGDWISRGTVGWKWIQFKREQGADLPGRDRLTEPKGGQPPTKLSGEGVPLLVA